MKVSELIKLLEKLPQDSEVIMQGDAEGNSYSPLSEISGDAIYVPATTWNGDVYPTDLSAEDNCLGDDEWEKLKTEPRCCVLFPTN